MRQQAKRLAIYLLKIHSLAVGPGEQMQTGVVMTEAECVDKIQRWHNLLCY